MHYEIRRVSLWSTFRFGLIAGIGLALLPGLCMATLVVQAVIRTAHFLAGLTDVNVALPTVDLGITAVPLPPLTLDLINMLGAQGATQFVDRLSTNLPGLFLLVAVLVVVVGALFLALPLVMVGLVYNLLAPIAGGFRVDVVPRNRR